ncbi:hypothetical protein QP944_06710 [Corynebacterium sp. MSK105]|uniref:hypothetical protein n=1 Tax=unclassified Corynebacterium TaxID=2624378 RepID=UPI001EF5CA37|nr:MULTISPECIES: hypothetical protein [unclassified Corynebacterium]MCG7445379.1 hypothetical protein [Corynebacterium sp. ACRPO]MDK8482792.1 hypothetical protein [Corynebacterium sp. MSK074]MDK8524505.1 hypothetical protein [Corynebacterium sp. MSK150]MDK8690228.1 hypothetical protein [Corynebacterium sp. MSK105]
MDLSLIQTHLDNFVTTWTGWKTIVDGITAWTGFSNAFEAAKGAFEFTGEVLPALSSK